jgi:chaperonin GroES
MNNYKTTQDRVVVKPDPDTEKTSSVFILAYNDETTRVGTVMLTGPGRVTKRNVTIPVSLQVGDRVMYTKDTGIAITVDGEALLLFREDELIGTVDEK